MGRLIHRWRDRPRPIGRALAWRILGIERQRRATLRAHLLQRLVELLAPGGEAEAPHEELHAVLLLVLVIAEAVEHAQDRLRDLEHLAGRGEVVDLVAGLAHERRAAPD